MSDHDIPHLPLYPERRPSTNPTGTLILKQYANITKHTITHNHQPLHAYPITLTSNQNQILDLLNIPTSIYTDA